MKTSLKYAGGYFRDTARLGDFSLVPKCHLMTLLASGLVEAKPKYPKDFDMLVTDLQMEPQKDIPLKVWH